MITQCFELLSLPIFKKVKLVSGQSGLYRMVTWVYVMQTDSLKGWVNGGEFVFIVSHSDLARVIREAVDLEISGVVVLRKEDDVSQLTEEIIQYADNHNLPLFEMDYRIRLVEVTKEISKYIIHKQNEYNSVSRLFYHVLFSDELNSEDMEELLLRHSFQREDSMFVAAVRSYDSSQLPQIANSIRRHLGASERYMVSLVVEDSFLLLFHGSNENIKKYLQSLRNVLELTNQEFNQLLYAGVGDITNSIRGVRRSYVKAVNCLTLCGEERSFVFYDELGFSRLLLDARYAKELRSYADMTLKPVLDYDKKNKNNFLEMIEAYILLNGNINRTAAKLFIHRNTCIYRLEKLKESFGLDLEDAATRADILNAIQIYRYFKVIK